MDSVISNLSTFGIGGLMAAAIVFIVWHHTSVTIPKLIEQSREDQKVFLQSLSEQERSCHAAIDKAINDTNAAWTARVERLTEKIEIVSGELKSLRERRI